MKKIVAYTVENSKSEKQINHKNRRTEKKSKSHISPLM